MLALIAAVATYCSRRSEGLAWADVVRLLVMAGIPILLVLVQPDLGTAMIMTIVLLVMLAVAGLPSRILVMLLVGAVAAVVVALEAGLLHKYQITRITSFLHQDARNLTKTQQAEVYNLQQAKTAIGSGGLFGTGLLHGAQTNLGYVPEQQTDFIFTAVGEQLGFVGATSVLALLALVSWRLLRIGQLARDSFGRLLCAGLFAFVAFSTFQNAGMTMGIMPITGIPLPIVSYGGTAVVCFFVGIGVALSVVTGGGPAEVDDGQPSFRVMEVVGVTVELPDQYPVVTLWSPSPRCRELTFRVGMAEGVALSQALRKLKSPRPLTHELFTTVLGRLGADVVAVRLTGRQGTVYLAELDLMSARGREVMSCRPSDGLTLAVRQLVPAPVLADERLLAGDGDVLPGPG